MQLPGLGRMVAFHSEGRGSDEESRLDTYMSKQVLKPGDDCLAPAAAVVQCGKQGRIPEQARQAHLAGLCTQIRACYAQGTGAAERLPGWRASPGPACLWPM